MIRVLGMARGRNRNMGLEKNNIFITHIVLYIHLFIVRFTFVFYNKTQMLT